MTKKTVRRQSVSRRTLLSRTAGLLGGAALSSGTALAQNTTPASPGTTGNPPPSASYANPAWLALRQEEIIEPGLEIVDPHHHLWDRPGNRFLISELLADTGSGHKITQTVFIECGSMYRADGPVEMKPVGETEFVNGTAAMSASGQYGPTRLCRGIVGHADLRLGDGLRVCWRPRSLPVTAAFAASATPSPGMRAMCCRGGAPIRRRGRCTTPLGAPALPVSHPLGLPSRPGFTIPSSPILPTSPAPSRKPRSFSTTSAGRSGSDPTRTKRPRPLRNGRPASPRSQSPKTSSSSWAGSA